MHIDTAATVAIVAALAANLAVAVFPVRVRLRTRTYVLGIWVTGPVTILGLWIAGAIPVHALVKGLLGNNGLVPWQIIVIFFATAYVSVSADNTGLFDVAAYYIVRTARGNGKRLFLSLYFFSLLLTLFTSNDIVILTLTPIIFYLGRHARLDVVPFLFTEYIAANTSSMLLYIGNPTNIIMGNALGLGFWSFSKAMFMPSLVASVGNLIALYLIFRKRLPPRYELAPASSYFVRSAAEAAVSAGLLLLMLIALGLSEYTSAPIWVVTAAAAVISLLKDLVYGLTAPRGARTRRLVNSIRKMPWMILPFVLVFFWLVQGLVDSGVVGSLASMTSKIAATPLTASLLFGGSSAIATNLMNNQPMSILFAQILVSPSLHLSNNASTAAAYAVVVASNIGANISLVGALAGLMWKRILSTKGIEIRFAEFLSVGLKATPPVLAATLFALTLSVTIGLG